MADRTYESTPPRRVAFLGLGVMGYPMAGHLHRAGHSVTVYNRSPAKAAQWASEYGGRSAPTPRQAAEGAEVVCACVGNDDDLRAVVLGENGAFAGMAAGAVFVDHTTASAEVARELAAVGCRRWPRVHRCAGVGRQPRCHQRRADGHVRRRRRDVRQRAPDRRWRSPRR
jgi:ornithine cyclodeaminase/alanine dehydrogenase-like protein (mu-crystallin family)